MNRRLIFSMITLLIFGAGVAMSQSKLVLINGNIATMTISAAKALAVKDGKIIFVGSNEEVKKYIDADTRVIDLDGKFVMPGFNESHAHFVGLGESLINIDLRKAKNWNELVEIVKQASANYEPGEWIIGRGWHQDKFMPAPQPNVNGYPIHDELSKAVPNNPVMLSHASGHAILVNQKAMELAGITIFTPNPAGGTIVRDKNGNAIGIFEENGENLIRRIYENYLAKRSKEQVRADYVKAISLASEDCLKKGITSFHDAGESFEVIDVMKQLADSNKLSLRLNVMIGDSYLMMKQNLAKYRMADYADGFLTVRSIKQYIDGALGSRGAWLLEPYSDLTSSTGSNVTSIDELKKIAELAISNGYQMRIHAIGDRGNREALNIYEEFYKKNPDKKDLRWSIEHAQHLSAEDIPRFAKLGVIAAMQPVHCTSDMGFVPIRLGNKRAEEGAYVWRKLLDSGAVICSGTDSPVEDVNPLECFYSAVTRKNSDGKEFYPDQKMTRLEALKSYTAAGAYASFEENIKGTIEKGKLADLVVLSNDILKCTDEEILKTKVLFTVVNGKVVYEAK